MSNAQYEKAKEQLFVEVCNAEKYQTELEYLAHEVREELAVLYRLGGYDENSEDVGTLVTNAQMAEWGVDVETLGQDAWANTKEKLDPLLLLCTGGRVDEQSNLLGMDAAMICYMSPVRMFILTNQALEHGAVYMFDTDTMQRVSEKLGGDLYVLPSSINEVLLFPTDEADDPKFLKDLVLEANADKDVIPDDIFLSNEIYLYDSSQHTLSIFTDFKQEQSILPDSTVSIEEMHDYGYSWDGMLPLGKERALELMEEGLQVFRLTQDNVEGMLDTKEDIESHDGLFGVEKGDWNAYLQRQNQDEGEGMVQTQI